MAQFKNGIIQGIIVKDIKRHADERGWLVECFRHDEVPSEIQPAMAYVSITLPGVARGPHEHIEQTDYFCFLGPGNFKVVLWDNRKESPTVNVRQVILAGEDNPKIVIVPPGVVHGYKNIGNIDGQVLNFPNRLYAGPGRTQKVDEIRHEASALSPFKMDE
ncbi:MAG: dTDP-4-dehydrorhamnose 3,5-epimerase family protein [Desulfovibrionales bacterium]|nr:dTDP-4-dehydrorhamnose 3,5-epimerase family protein [Desulfovibrionales bacterium]